MAEGDGNGEPVLPAGTFSAWLTEVQGAIRDRQTSDVPCGGCTACCMSSQFVHIEPDEVDTLSHIPAELLFPAPRLPRGQVLLGYDERGHCPMLIDNGCSIYEHRPRACRTYDCRVFPAAGIRVVDDKQLISQRVQRWQFDFPTEADRMQHEAVRAAATFLDEHTEIFPDSSVPLNATQRAVLAIDVHDAFLLREEETSHMTVVDPNVDAVRVDVKRRTQARRRT